MGLAWWSVVLTLLVFGSTTGFGARSEMPRNASLKTLLSAPAPSANGVRREAQPVSESERRRLIIEEAARLERLESEWERRCVLGRPDEVGQFEARLVESLGRRPTISDVRSATRQFSLRCNRRRIRMNAVELHRFIDLSLSCPLHANRERLVRFRKGAPVER